MNKSEFITAVAKLSGLTKADVKRVFDAEITTITKTLKKGDIVRFTGFGTYSTVKRSARKGRNPITGATIKIPAKKLPKFKPGKTLKNAVKTAK